MMYKIILANILIKIKLTVHKEELSHFAKQNIPEDTTMEEVLIMVVEIKRKLFRQIETATG